MLTAKLRILRRVEIILLLLFMLSLPVLEAPKNIFWGLYALCWLVGRGSRGDFGGAWKAWDTLFALWIVSATLSSLWGALMPVAALPVDVLRYVGLAWMLMRAGYSKETLYTVFITVVIATLIALGQGYWALLGAGTGKYLQFHSVGHVNHTAIYLAIVLCAVFARFIAEAVVPPYRTAYLWLAMTTLLAASLLAMASRGATVAAILTLLAYMGLTGGIKNIKPRALLAIFVTFVVAVGAYIGLLESRPEVFANGIAVKSVNNLAQRDYLSNRDRLWELAAVAGIENPGFGVGIDQFGKIGASRYCEWRKHIEPTYACTAEDYLNLGHAHNLYLNTLAERGFIGLGILFVVLAAWLRMLLKTRAAIGDDCRAGTLWGAAFSAWGVTVISGLFNTSLHHEHALLAVSLLALWLSWSGSPQQRMQPSS